MSQKKCKIVASAPTRRHVWDPDLPRHRGYKLVPCKYCHRTFFANRVEYHEDICRVTRLLPKRPTFDPVKARLAGTVAELFQDPYPQTDLKRSLNPRWREIRQGYLEAAQGLSAKVTPSPTAGSELLSKICRVTTLTNNIQCPICGRRFLPAVALRHIAHCTTYTCPNPTTTAQSTPTSTPVPSTFTPRATQCVTVTQKRQVGKVQSKSVNSETKPKLFLKEGCTNGEEE